MGTEWFQVFLFAIITDNAAMNILVFVSVHICKNFSSTGFFFLLQVPRIVMENVLFSLPASKALLSSTNSFQLKNI